MIKKILIALLFIQSYVHGHGFIGSTLVKTPTGYTEIKFLKKNNFVVSYDYEGHCVERRIKKIYKKLAPEIVSIFVDRVKIETTPDHLFYDPEINTWIKASEICPFSTHFLKKCDQFAEPTFIQYKLAHIDRPFEVYDLEIDEYHNFCVSTEDILVHNFVVEVGVVWTIGEGLAWIFGITTLGAGAKLAYDMAQKERKLSIRPEIDAPTVLNNMYGGNRAGGSSNNEFRRGNGTDPNKPPYKKGDHRNRSPRELEKENRSLGKNIRDHEKKLKDYTEDPYKYDNQDKLKNAQDNKDRENIINGRKKHLNDEIEEWKDKISKNNINLGKVS